MEAAYMILTITICLSTYVLISVAGWAYGRRKKHQLFQKYGIPGPQPTSFLRGNMDKLKSADTPNEVLEEWLKRYGDVFGYYIGEVPYLVMNNLDMLKQVTIKDFQFFSNRPDFSVPVKPLIYTILALKGSRWKEVRSAIGPTFSASKMKSMTTIMNRKVDILLEIVTQKAKSEEMFDIYTNMEGLTLDVIAGCALAMEVNCQRDLNDPFLLAVRTYFQTANSKAVELAIMFPLAARLMALVGNYLSAGKMTSMLVENLKEAINLRRQNPEFRRIDMVQLMLDASENTDGTEKRKTARLTDNEIIGNAYVFLLAGYETTATALAFTFYLLIQNPEVQQKVYEEVQENIPDGPCSFDEIQKLQYLDQVFNESLRMYPPVTGFVTRQCVQECTIGDVVVPEGVVVQAPVWSIHHDPELWPDPWKFDPERFTLENKSQIQDLSFLPFGVGPRNCMGMRFAQLEARLTIARLIQKFKFVPCEKTDNPLKLVCPTVIINPANGVYLRAISREKK